ncbi:hypothetical protein OG749_03200 [Streptomyces nojiriensis]|uniref:hypothetical protein n=1 Tax=Streptomyces nojiriensis TaxID=66374 RepID=UPI002E183E62
MAEQLIEALTRNWDAEQFPDTFREKVTAMTEAMPTGGTAEKAEAPGADVRGRRADRFEKAAADITGRSHMPRDDLGKALSPSRK